MRADGKERVAPEVGTGEGCGWDLLSAPPALAGPEEALVAAPGGVHRAVEGRVLPGVQQPERHLLEVRLSGGGTEGIDDG